MKRLLSLLQVIICVLSVKADVVSDHGAWCWFADPRALHNESPDGRTNVTYIGYIDNLGNIRAGQYDFNKRKHDDVLVRACFQPDDHDNPTFLVVPDGRVMVFYSRHTDEPCFYYRITAQPGDITTLGAEHIISTDHNTTYPSPFILADDPGHFYLCWRGINWHPTIARYTLPDADGKVSVDYGPCQIVQSTGARPYAKYASDGSHRIFVVYTTGHPDNEDPNYIYYNYIDINDMSLYDVNGVRQSVIADGPLHVDKSDGFVADHPAMVVDASPYRDWVWQVAVGRDGSPIIAMTRISRDKKSHNYYLAKWSDGAWQLSHLAHGGGHFHQSPNIEHCYSAGMAIDTDDPHNIYCSVPVNGIYEIVRYRVDDKGEIVSTDAVTKNSPKNNVRPYCIPGTAESQLRLAWMQGDYYDWIVSAERPLGYDTRMMCDFGGFDRFGADPQSSINVVSLPYRFDGDDFVITVPVDVDMATGLFTALDLGGIKYVIDNKTHLPEIRYGKRSFRGINPIADSSGWRHQPRSTNGKWYDPVPLEHFTLTLMYADGEITTMIDGSVDQRIRVKPPKASRHGA